MDKTTDDERPAEEVVEQIYSSVIKALSALLRRSRITQATHDLIKGNIDFTYNTVKGHPCSTAVYVLSELCKVTLNIGSLITAFEDHLEEGHGDETPEQARETASIGPELVTERTDNVIHVDLSKGRKN